MNRRDFLKKSASAGIGLSVINSNKLKGDSISPNDKINIGFIGCGTQGLRQLMRHISNEEIRIVSVCDVNKNSEDYIEWYKGELKGKIRSFLNEPDWDKNIKGCRAGHDVAKEIITKYYASKYGESDVKCSTYFDYREMLEKEKDLDAVYIMTPDHQHANIAVAAMKKRKHVIMHKPLATSIEEIKYVTKVAEETGVATHMFCAENLHTTPLLSEWIWDGAIGNVIEVHNWSTRPVWPQGWTEYPSEKVDIPEGFNWDLWLGTAQNRDFHPNYTHSLFRGWRDFGTGALGDMGHYSFRQIFQILKLDRPYKIEGIRNRVSKINDLTWEEKSGDISYPHSSMIHFDFPSRGNMPEVKISWYDGSLRPSLPKELEIDARKMPREGALFIGEKGKILADFMGGSPRIIPESDMKKYQRPVKYLERPIDGFQQWINECKGGKQSSANFHEVAKLSETVCLGNISLLFDEKLNYGPASSKFTNSIKANEYLKRELREGWNYLND